MFVIARALTYAALFIGLIFIYLPGQLLAWAGIPRPMATGPLQIAGMIIGGIGAAIALWCVFTFAAIGKGTPAPFDPPRRLVIEGPYRFVRNPMYICATLGLAGATIFTAHYRSRFTWARFCLPLTCSSFFTKNRPCENLSARSTKPTASESDAGLPSELALPFKN